MEKRGRGKVFGRLALVLAALLLGLVTAYADPPGTERVSVDTTGGDPDDSSGSPSVSADGRYVAFQSWATDLVPGGTDGRQNIFVRDRRTDTTARVTVDTTGGNPDDDSEDPVISADGRYVAFQSKATDLVAPDGAIEDIFVRDRQTNTTTRVSANTGGGEPNGGSYNPAISANGRYVAFQSSASDLVASDGNAVTDIFVRDLVANTTTRVSVDTTGGDPDDHSFNPSVSADGRYVAFQSRASDLVTGDNGLTEDIFVHDRDADGDGVFDEPGQVSTTRASVDTTGGDPDNGSRNSAISADGRYVAFQSQATDLVTGDNGLTEDIFVRDLHTNTTTRVSVNTTGGNPDGPSLFPSISADGRYVAFQSDATNLVDGDTNSRPDVFVHDLHTGQTTRASVGSGGTQGDQYSRSPSISADGRYVAFESDATNLVPDDNNLLQDIFVRSLGDPALVITKQAEPDPAWAGGPLTYTLTISETDGLFYASGLVVSDTVPASTTCCASIGQGGMLVGNDVLWSGLTVSSSQSISLTFVVTVNQVPSGTVLHNAHYRAVISTTKGITGATGSAVTTTVWVRPIFLPVIQRSYVITP